MKLLNRLFPRKISDLEAKLTGNQHGVKGEVEFEYYSNGHWSFEIEVEHSGVQLQGPLELRMEDQAVAQMQPHRSETEYTLSSRQGHSLPFEPVKGTKVEVFSQNGLSLSGVFTQDR